MMVKNTGPARRRHGEEETGYANRLMRNRTKL